MQRDYLHSKAVSFYKNLKGVKHLNLKQKIALNSLFLVILIFSFYFQIFNPFDPIGIFANLPPVWKGTTISNPMALFQIFFKLNYFSIFIIVALILINIISLLKLWRLNQKEERRWFFIMAFILSYIIAISPSIYCFRLWSEDSAYHLVPGTAFYCKPKLYLS